MRWLLGIGGDRCGGGLFDCEQTSPAYYLEQARQTVLGGAREIILFDFGEMCDRDRDAVFGPENIAALMEELPLHFELAQLIHGERPRGLLGWKPSNSPPGADHNLHVLLGMAGFPVTAAHEFDSRAAGFVFGHHVLHDPHWPEALNLALKSGRPILVTPAFMSEAAAAAEEYRVDVALLKDRTTVLPSMSRQNRWEAVEAMSEAELNALRARALEPMGITFRAPARVALYLFDDDIAVVESFRDEAAECMLEIAGWHGFDHALQLPAAIPRRPTRRDVGQVVVLPRALLALRRAGDGQ